ncbi:MAG: hypothetical protein ACRC4W_04740 [Treponemataceae bacterium]
MNKKNERYESDLTCPFCGFVEEDSWECNDSYDTYDCPRCGEEFYWERIVIVYYSSWQKKEDK